MKWLLTLTVSVILLAGCATLGLSEPTPTPIPTPTPFTEEEAIGLVQTELRKICHRNSLYLSIPFGFEAEEQADGTFIVKWFPNMVPNPSATPAEKSNIELMKSSEWKVFPQTLIVTTVRHIPQLCRDGR